MSQLNVNTIKNRVGNSGPTFDGNTTVSGILTATSFSGDGSSLTDLTLTGDANLGNLDVTGVSTFAGNINASSADFSGNVTIGGTLTYRDVENIDAVGMVTARKGIQVLADGLTVVGVATFNDDVKLLDNDKATFGNDGDLEIYHSSTASHIVDVGTGNFIVGSNGGALKITKGDDTENMAVFTPDGSAALYYDNAKKLETSSTGVEVTGGVGIADSIFHIGDNNTAVRFPAADTFAVETAGSERVRVDSSGNMGLGTTSPSQILELKAVEPRLCLNGTTANNQKGIEFEHNGTRYGSLLQNASSGEMCLSSGDNGSSYVITFKTDNSERMRISSDGVVTAKNGTVAEIDTLVDNSTVTPDFAASTNFTLTFTSAVGNSRTIANPSSLTAGQSGSIFLVQDSTGSRTVSWGSYWDWASGTAPTLTTTGSAVDRIDYIVRTSTSIHAVATLAYS